MDLISLVHQAAQKLDTLSNAALAPIDITPRQAIVLNEIRIVEGRNQFALVQATGIDRSTLTDIIKRLVRHGYIERKRDPADARAYIVSLTDKGRSASERARIAIDRMEKDLLESLPIASGTVMRSLELLAHGPEPIKQAA